MKLRPDDPRPLHTQIYDDLCRKIADGTYRPGDKLPSLRDLAATYEVAEPTVHAAIRQLQHDGLVASTSGRGTYVQAAPDTTDELAELRAKVDQLEARLADVERRLRKPGRAARDADPQPGPPRTRW